MKTLPSVTPTSAEEVCRRISRGLTDAGLWRLPDVAECRRWRVSPQPFPIAAELAQTLERLGPALQRFYAAADVLYRSERFAWVNEYLDLGKPESVREHNRMNYQKRRLPLVIRPDIMLTEAGPRITELDSVPGGIGQTDCLSAPYEDLGFELVGSPRGLLNGFREILSEAAGAEHPAAAIIVSDESDDYRPEMRWLAAQLREMGQGVWTVRPEEVIFTEDGLFLPPEITQHSTLNTQLSVIYRFFELFDLKNIPKADLLVWAAKHKRVTVTPPYKAHLEEKSLLALLHHPLLSAFWTEQLCSEDLEMLRTVVAPTWILDPRPVPPHASIHGLTLKGMPIRDWRELGQSTQKERRMVLKPSGFSPLAWGSRGVVVGHDVSQAEWAAAIERALAEFESGPWVLQEFHEGKRFTVEYLDEECWRITTMGARVRLSPYYFVSGGQAKLCGALATACPSDKKLIHGMTDAVLMPSMVDNDT